MSSKRKRLTLKEKIEVLDVAEKEKLSLRSLAERFKVGKTQMGQLLKEKEEIRKQWITNANEDSKNKFRKTATSAVDEVVIKWFRSVRAKNIPVSGVLLQEKAREVGESLGFEDFKASNRWLEKFQKRHNISFKAICGEEKSVDPAQVEDWIKRLKPLCEGYDDRNIFNCDETGLFYRILPDKTLCFKNEKCSGGKISKERLTILLCCNMLGEFEKPLVIGKAKKPRCFKNIDVQKLSVSWRNNKKAWMTTSIMTDWLIDLDKRMKKQRRKILLFLDNATSHPEDLKLKNVKLVFLPPNTTSVLQPLDLGIIRSFKVGYRKLLLRHILSKITTCGSSEELSKAVSVLDAVSWTTSALKNVQPGSVMKCFKKAGFYSKCDEDLPENVPATDKDLEELVGQLNPNVCAEDYLQMDDDLCIEEDAIVTDFISPNTTATEAVSEDEEEEEEATEDDTCDIKNYLQALKSTQELRKFYLSKGDTNGLTKVNELIIELEKQIFNSKKINQTVLTDYFK